MVLGQLPLPLEASDLDPETDDGPEKPVQALALEVQRPGLGPGSFVERDGPAQQGQEVLALLDDLQGTVGMHGDVVPGRDQSRLLIPRWRDVGMRSLDWSRPGTTSPCM